MILSPNLSTLPTGDLCITWLLILLILAVVMLIAWAKDW